MRSISRVALAALFFASTPSLASDAGTSATLASILARAADHPLGAESLPLGPGSAVAELAGVETLPVACASPIVAALARAAEPPAATLRANYGAIAARPNLETARNVVTRDGRFTIHYSESSRSLGARPLDRDRNGTPDIVDRVGEALSASRSFLVTRLGFADPAPDDQRLDVFLIDLGHGLEGFAVPGASGNGGGASGTAPFIVLDANLPGDRIMAATLHQVAHAVLNALSSLAAPWWSEATAGYLTLAATGDLQGAEAGLRARLQSSGRGLAADDLLLMQGSLLWPLFLSERIPDPNVVREIWEAAGAFGLDPLAATDQVLRRGFGLSLSQMYREYTIWNLFTGARDDGRHYSVGRQLPGADLQAVGPNLPLALDPVEAIEPLGSVAFRVPGDQRRGSLDLEVRADGGEPSVDLLVAYASENRGAVLVPVPLNATGGGHRSVPWGDAREAWVILRNGLSTGTTARLEVRGTHDPYAPFDLAGLSAEASGSAISLQWGTTSEKGLLGWNVYRGETPTGPFVRLNSVAMPALGDGSSETGYVFLDETARPGRRYYYQIEGYTDLGLAERSQVVSGRIPPSR